MQSVRFGRHALVLALSILGTVLLTANSSAVGVYVYGQGADGTWAGGFAYDRQSKSQALSYAMGVCRGAGYLASQHCKLIASFSNTCFALAIQNRGNGYGFATRSNIRSARSSALAKCQKYGSRCYIRDSGCDTVAGVAKTPRVAATATQRGLSMDMNRYCKENYGSASRAHALNRHDAASWRCRVHGRLVGVDLQKLCEQQYGAGYKYALGNKYDAASWSCVPSRTTTPAVATTGTTMTICTKPIFDEVARLKTSIDGTASRTNYATHAAEYLMGSYCRKVLASISPDGVKTTSDSCSEFTGIYLGERVYWGTCNVE